MNSMVLNPYPEPSTLILGEFGSDGPGHNSCNGDGNDGMSSEENSLHHTIGVVPIRLPYDLPLRKYDFNNGDHVWLADKQFPGQDDFGNTLAP